MNIKAHDDVVIYDSSGMFSVARAWFMFRVFNHTRIKILEGGFPQWRRLGYPVETELVEQLSVLDPIYPVHFNTHMIMSREQIYDNILSGETQLIDARSENRFLGLCCEPRPNMKSGHVPNAVNIPYDSLLEETEQGECIKSAQDLMEIFDSTGIKLDEDSKATGMCGSGITACIVLLALHICGKPIESLSLYDGSWVEWVYCFNQFVGV